MRLHILGPLEVHDATGAPVEVTGVKRRALLASLVVCAGRTVSTERLIAELWGERPPANAANALQAQMRRLRKTIEDAGGAADRIHTRPPGYVLELRPGAWTKGSSITAFMQEAPFKGRTPIFIGDDVTDEAAFEVLPEFNGVGFSVGREVQGIAGMFEAPSDVRRWIAEMVRAPQEKR